MKNVRCAIIGIGSMGKKYAVMIHSGKIKGLELTAVCCRSKGNQDWAKTNLNSNVRIFESEEALYTNSDCFDAVIIVTPHKLHPSMSIRALKAGKYVMCDKPAATTVYDAKELNTVAERENKVFAMMCHQRTYPQYKKIKELLVSQAIGKISRISWETNNYFRTKFYHQSADWRSSWVGEGGGALINQGYHILDMWIYLFGFPQAVYANIPFGKYNDFAVDDEATLIMNYPDKVTGMLFISTGEGALTERLEVIGTKGRILLNGKTLTLTTFDCDIREYAQTASVTSRQELGISEKSFIMEEPQNPYETMLQNFSDAILYGKELIAAGIDSLSVLSLINASYLSAFKEQKIEFPFDYQEYKEFLKIQEEKEKIRR